MFVAFIDLIDSNANYQNTVQRIVSRYITDDKLHKNNVLFKKTLIKKSISNPKDTWNNLLSWLFVQQKEYEKALIQEKALYNRNPEFIVNIIDLGYNAYDNKAYNTAKNCFDFILEKSLHLDQKLIANLYIIKIAIATNQSNIDELFTAIFNTYGKKVATLRIQLAYADYLTFNKNQPEKALEILETAINSTSSKFLKAEIKLKLGDVHVFLGNYNRALIYFSQVQTSIKNHPLAQQARFKVAQTSYFKNDFTWAFAQLKLLDSETTSDILIELDEDVREKIFEQLTAKEIAEEIEELDTDDAADIIAELPEERQEAVMSQIEDAEHLKEIEELLTYDENSAGGLMAKELVQVNENWNVLKCVKEMRIQAEEVTRVHSIYVVNNTGQLKGRLSLKDLLVASTRTHISEIYIPKVDAVHVNDSAEDVANIMRKYDLEAIPVVDDNEVLLGRITIDDIVDVIKEEADKDYQMAAGLTQDVDSDDSILDLTKARLPWLFLGLVGGIGAFLVMGGFEESFSENAILFFFTPLIAAMAAFIKFSPPSILTSIPEFSKLKSVNKMSKNSCFNLSNAISQFVVDSI
ncbi:predicted protein [Nematostella vectensis]|uniref:CBS domain-containing protein n=1 Tax=Nematostella vectensis TaxID=45351 RepID=A7T8Y4_NEMVE|nr:predicted protein [Nematostella vectensis]|eukprot:XP_001619650.1 hypothetical protein NEMVEDRAFT_v1g223975 [Nematostella vectensis]